MLTINARGSLARMSSVPLPWCTSKSTTATRRRLYRCSAYLAATATVLKKQKPMALSRQGGRRGLGGVVALRRGGHAGDQQAILNGVQPFGAFGVARAHLVLPTIPMGEIARLAHSLVPACRIFLNFSDNVMP